MAARNSKDNRKLVARGSTTKFGGEKGITSVRTIRIGGKKGRQKMVARGGMPKIGVKQEPKTQESATKRGTTRLASEAGDNGNWR